MQRREMVRITSLMAGTSLISGILPAIKTMGKFEQSNIVPYQIDFGKDQIKELHRKIDMMNWPEIPFETGWSAGTNDKILRDLVSYWRHEYDWFKIQKALNQLNHYHATIEGERLHFVRYKSNGNQQSFPIMLLHGWPSSFLEFKHAAPLLADGLEGKPGFEVIVPSLPGFAFSDAPQSPGMHIGKIAERMHTFMKKLGYGRYGIYGGDWGAVIAVEMARKFPESVVGLHYVAASTGNLPEQGKNEKERAFIARQRKFNTRERAYYELQSTKPQTLAYALHDSPVGLLAWILEKYWGWTDHGQDLWSVIAKDDVLSTVMLYWLTGHVLSAARIYYERVQMMAKDWSEGPVTVPTGYSRFPGEPWGPPRSLIHPDWSANLVYYNELPRGGHFPALEVPELWAKEIVSFFSKIR